MARWTAQVFVDSSVGTITAEVEAGTNYGAEQQIKRIYGPVQQIVNLRQVRQGGSSSSSSGGGGIGLVVLLLVGAAMIGGGKGDKTTPVAPTPAPQSYERIAPTPSYANPAGPCVTANFEPC